MSQQEERLIPDESAHAGRSAVLAVLVLVLVAVVSGGTLGWVLVQISQALLGP